MFTLSKEANKIAVAMPRRMMKMGINELVIKYLDEYLVATRKRTINHGSVQFHGIDLSLIRIFNYKVRLDIEMIDPDIDEEEREKMQKIGKEMKELNKELHESRSEVENRKIIKGIRGLNGTIKFDIDSTKLEEGYKYLKDINAANKTTNGGLQDFGIDPKQREFTLSDDVTARLIYLLNNEGALIDIPEKKNYLKKGLIYAVFLGGMALSGLIGYGIKECPEQPKKPKVVIVNPQEQAYQTIIPPSLILPEKAEGKEGYNLLDILKADDCLTVKEKNYSYYKAVEDVLPVLGYASVPEPLITRIARKVAYANGKKEEDFIPGRACYDKGGENCIYEGEKVCKVLETINSFEKDLALYRREEIEFNKGLEESLDNIF